MVLIDAFDDGMAQDEQAGRERVLGLDERDEMTGLRLFQAVARLPRTDPRKPCYNHLLSSAQASLDCLKWSVSFKPGSDTPKGWRQEAALLVRSGATPLQTCC